MPSPLKDAHTDPQFEAGYIIGALSREQLRAVIPHMAARVPVAVFADELRKALLAMIKGPDVARDFLAAFEHTFPRRAA